MTRRATTRLLLAGVLLVGGSPLQGQGASSAASRTAASFFDAIRDARWREAAALVDPASAASFRADHLSSLLAWVEHRDLRHGDARRVLLPSYMTDLVQSAFRLHLDDPDATESP